MAQVGLKRAAELTGKDQSTIHRAMKNGRLSFTLSESGERMIDTSELDRVFPITPPADEAAIARKDAPELQSNDMQVDVQVIELRAQLEIEKMRVGSLQERIADKETMIADLREDRDHWRKQAESSARLLTFEAEKPATVVTPTPPAEPPVAETPAPARKPERRGIKGWLHRITE